MISRQATGPYAKGTEVILYRVYKSSVLIAPVVRGGRNIKRAV